MELNNLAPRFPTTGGRLAGTITWGFPDRPNDLPLDFSRAMENPICKSLGPLQLRELKRFAGRINKFGVNFAVCDGYGELILLCEADKFQSERAQLIEASRQALNRAPSDKPRNRVLATVLKRGSEVVGTALIDLGDDISGFPLRNKSRSGVSSAVSRDTQYDISEPILGEMLELLAENFQTAFKAEQQIEKIGAELAQTYEELVLLHKLSTNMKLTEQDANFLQMACDSLTEIVSVEGIVILLEKTVEGEKRLMVAAGSGLIDIDEQMASILHCRLTDEINEGREALLDSEVDSPFKYDWPENIKNIIAVPLCGKEKTDSPFSHKIRDGSYIVGLMVAINRIGKGDFDSTDVKLFNSVANRCAVFVENGRLFSDLKELFIGSLKALTSSIDAKDKYTRGHSDRVAFISRWIAKRLAEIQPMEQERINKIYLAGLLHDIGKIGIEEVVLRKEGKLTEQELNRIRAHPSIGASILGAIKQMRDILPGVLSHHERIDGQGYPQGLAGEQIPLIGKIVGLADSFDAMTSKRAYRDARTVEQALEEIAKGLGTQFDQTIGRVFLDSDVYQLWDIIQSRFNGIYESSESCEYGIAAVGTLIK
ncbi:MAG: HD domain-containing phosphohydrolase [Sedimentisphaerales bacterium]